MAVVEDGVVFAIGLGDLIEALRDQIGANAVAGHEGERRLEEVQPPKSGKLIEHHQQVVPPALLRIALEPFGQTPSDLVEDQTDEGLGAADVRRRYDEVERDRRSCVHKVGDAPITGRGRLRHDRIAVEAEERHRRGQDARAFVLRLVQHLPRRRRDDGMNHRIFRDAEMVGLHHPAQGVSEAALRIGQEAGDTREGLLLLRIEDVEDRPDQQGVAGFLPVAAPFERSFRIDEDVGDVLNVPHLVGTFADFQQRIVARRAGIGRVEHQAMREASPPSRGERPVLAFDVMDDRRTRPR
ncbi:hypothetical protein D3C73_936360 [compost metagenome]